MNELSAHDRMILDLEKTPPAFTAREAVRRLIDLPTEKYTVLLQGMVEMSGFKAPRNRIPDRLRA